MMIPVLNQNLQVFNFSKALEYLKSGDRVTKKDILNEGYFYLEPGVINAAYVKEECLEDGEKIPEYINNIRTNLFTPIEGDVYTVNPYICLVTSFGVTKGYTFSIEEILAEDWCLF